MNFPFWLKGSFQVSLSKVNYHLNLQPPSALKWLIVLVVYSEFIRALSLKKKNNVYIYIWL